MEQVRVNRLLPQILPSWFPDNAVFAILASCLFTPFLFYRFRTYDCYFGANQPGAWIAYLLSKINKKPYAIYLAQPTRLIHPRLIDQKIGMRLTDGVTTLGILTKIFRPIIQVFDTISIRGTKLVFANGSYMTGVLKEVYGAEPINCPGGSNVKQHAKVARSKRFTGSLILTRQKITKPYLLITNRHFAQKKFEYAIEARELLANDMPLVITGQQTDYTRTLQRKYRRKKQLHFVGLLSEKELDNAYSNAAVYVYPAPEEDFGMGIIEAMAHGVPVVAWGNAGPTGILTHETDGLLAKPFEVSDFARSIARLLQDKSLYQKIVKNAYNTIGKTFTYDQHIEVMDRYLRENI